MGRVRYKPIVLGLSLCMLAFFVYYWAYAFGTGKTGQTLKTSPTAGCGAKTTGGGSCHGTLPTSSIVVRIGGPRILALGATGTFTLSDSGSTGKGGGFDIAASNGILGANADSIQLQAPELTHTRPLYTPYLIRFTLTSSIGGPDTIFANGKGAVFSTWNWAPNFIIRVGPPPAPVPDSPLAKSTGVPLTPRLVWSGIAGARWTVELATDSAFAAPVVHQVVSGDTTLTVKPGVLLNDTVYYWHVSATDTGGTSAYSSPPRSFRTIVAPPAAPILASPANKATGVPPNLILRWRKNAAAASYRVQLSTDSTFASVTRDSSGIIDTSFTPGVLSNGSTFYWRVNGKNAGGTGSWSAVSSFVVSLTDVAQTGAGIPSVFGLAQNYPNPFNPSTKIRFLLPAASRVRLVVYDVQGREVAVLAQGALGAGVYTATFDAGALRAASGVYFYRFTASAGEKQYVETRKLVLVR